MNERAMLRNWKPKKCNSTILCQLFFLLCIYILLLCCAVLWIFCFFPISRSQVSICNAGLEIDIAKHLFEANASCAVEEELLQLLLLLRLVLFLRLVLQLLLRSKCFEFRCQRRCRRLCRRFGRPISQSTLCDGHGSSTHSHTHTRTRTTLLHSHSLCFVASFQCLETICEPGQSFVRSPVGSFRRAPHSTVAETKGKFYQPFIGAVICMRKPFKITWSMQPANS